MNQPEAASLVEAVSEDRLPMPLPLFFLATPGFT